jgi:hypothetical protein
MSDKRDFLRFSKTIATSINAGVSKQFDFDAALATHVKCGPILGDSHRSMHGKIEAISVAINNTTVSAGSGLSVFFYANTNFDCATLTSDPYIDHEDFTKGSFAYNNASKKPARNTSAVAIHYYNITDDKKIHFAVRNNTAATAFPTGTLRISVVFRPDYGE